MSRNLAQQELRRLLHPNDHKNRSVRNYAIGKNNLEEISILRSRREHPQEEELQTFKREFKAWQESRVRDLYSSHLNERRKERKPVESSQGNSSNQRLYRRSRSRGNPNDAERFPELKYGKMVDRSPSPTRIVVLKPTDDGKDDVEELFLHSPDIPMGEDAMNSFLEQVRERLRSQAEGKENIRREKGVSTKFDRERNTNGRKSTGSMVLGELEVRTQSFREGHVGFVSGDRDRDRDHPANIARCISEPISGAALNRVLQRAQDSLTTEKPTTKERKPKKDFFNLKGRISHLRRALTLGGKLFRRKNRLADHSIGIISASPSSHLLDQDNLTEVPPSPASVSISLEDTWKPSLPSPVSPLEIPFHEEISSDNPEITVQTALAETTGCDESSTLHDAEEMKSNEENYLRRILLTAGIYNQPLNIILALCYSPTDPLAEWVFKEVEKDHTVFSKAYSGMNPLETVSSRRILFDLLNEEVLRLISSPAFSSMKRMLLRCSEELMKDLWKQLERCFCLANGESTSLDSLISSDLKVDPWICPVGMDDVGEAVEDMILSQLIEELTC